MLKEFFKFKVCVCVMYISQPNEKSIYGNLDLQSILDIEFEIK